MPIDGDSVVRESPETTLARYADALTLMRDLQRNHPFVAGCAKRLGDILEGDVQAFRSVIELRRHEAAAGQEPLSVNIKSMRQSVEELLRYRSSLSSERHALKQRIEEYLLLFSRDDDASNSTGVPVTAGMSPNDIGCVLNEVMQPVYSQLERIGTQGVVESRASVTSGSNLGTGSATRVREIRSPYLAAIRQALLAVGLSASAQSVATWIAENLGDVEFRQIVKKYGRRTDLGILYHDEPSFRRQFDRDVTKVRARLKA